MSTDIPVTPAIRMLRAANVAFEPHLYDYEEKGGTKRSSEWLGVPEHQVIKTLIMETDTRKPLVVLMHGDAEVSTKALARLLQVKTIQPCSPDRAQKHSGYLVGGTSPFGLKLPMPIYVEQTIWELPRLWINGGKRGFLIALEPLELRRVLQPQDVSVGIYEQSS